ncbi:MAG: CopG family transcriptional regulator [Egibacteraceae bacterium]
MTTNKIYRTESRRELTEADIAAIADEVEHADYDIAELQTRRGRPLLGSAPAEVVPVRLDPALRQAVAARAAIDNTTTSEIIRNALRAYLHVV